MSYITEALNALEREYIYNSPSFEDALMSDQVKDIIKKEAENSGIQFEDLDFIRIGTRENEHYMPSLCVSFLGVKGHPSFDLYQNLIDKILNELNSLKVLHTDFGDLDASLMPKFITTLVLADKEVFDDGFDSNGNMEDYHMQFEISFAEEDR